MSRPLPTWERTTIRTDRYPQGLERNCHPPHPRVTPPRAWQSSAPAGSVSRWRAPCAPRASPSRARWDAASAPESEVVLLCVPDGSIADAAEIVGATGFEPATSGAQRFVGHVSGATPLAALQAAQAEAFGIHPLQTFAGGEGAEAFARHRRRDRRDDPGGARRRARPGAAARHDADRDLRRRARRLPRRRVDRLELPGHAAGRGRAMARRRRHRARRRPHAARSRWSAARSRTGPSSGRGEALTGPVARGDDATVARQRGAVEHHAPELLPLFDALVDRHARAGRATRWHGMRTVRTVAELRAALAARREAGRADRPGADDGLVPRRAPRADARRARGQRRASSCRCSSTRRSSVRREDLAAYPRDEARDAALAAGGRRRPAVRAAGRGGLSRRLRDHGQRRRRQRGARAATPHAAVAATSTASRRSSPSSSTWSARRRVLRPEGRPAGRW